MAVDVSFRDRTIIAADIIVTAHVMLPWAAVIPGSIMNEYEKLQAAR